MTQLKFGFLGPGGTFTEEAVAKYPLAAEAVLIPYPSIPEVIMAVAQGQVQEGIVPTENSIEGAVNVSLDMLVHQVDLQIKYEVVLPVQHNLLARPGTKIEDVEIVYSHPQALAQCANFTSGRLSQAAVRSTTSTTVAASLVSESQEKWAAIGTKTAAQLYGLEILVEGIQAVNDNYTRFLVLAQDDHPPTGQDKTSIAFAQQKDRPGGLYSIMGEFALRNINLTRIESRPTRKMLGEYIFFLDLEGHRKDEVVREALEQVAEKTTFFKILGSYPRYVY